jgi:hypothetical protein
MRNKKKGRSEKEEELYQVNQGSTGDIKLDRLLGTIALQD